MRSAPPSYARRGVAALLLLLAAAEGTATLHLLDEARFPHARCLDGSNAGYYYRKGNSNFVINLEGGGECVTQSSCASRANSSLGSSNFFEKSKTLIQIQSELEPVFGGFSQIFVPYCGG